MPFFNDLAGNAVRSAGQPTSSIEGFATNLVSGAVSGIPIVGGLASGLVNVVGGLLGGNNAPEARGGNLWDGLQKPGAPLMDANALTQNDAQVFADAARRNNLYVQEINDLIAFNMRYSRNPWQLVVNYYRDHPEQVAADMVGYNRENPGAPLVPHQPGVVETMSTRLPLTGGTATQPFVASNTAAATPAPTTDDKTTTYALIGGGALVAIILLILILKK